jgi:hypothetical protein
VPSFVPDHVLEKEHGVVVPSKLLRPALQRRVHYLADSDRTLAKQRLDLNKVVNRGCPPVYKRRRNGGGALWSNISQKVVSHVVNMRQLMRQIHAVVRRPEVAIRLGDEFAHRRNDPCLSIPRL